MTAADRSSRTANPGILTWLWRAWPWMNWLLPLLLIAHGALATFGGWTWFVLIFSAPITIVVSVLLGWIPRRLLRRKGYTAVTAPLGVSLLVSWWSMIAAIVLFVDTVAQEVPSESVPSVIRLFGDPAIDVGLERVLMGVALVTAAISWVVLCVLAVCARAPEPSVSPRGASAAWATAIGVPMLFVAMMAVGAATTLRQVDSAGETVGVVNARPIVEQAERALVRYDGFQEQVAAVRALIAPEGWTTSSPHGLEDDPEECRSVVDPCYRLTWAYSVSGTVDTAQLAAALPDVDWAVTDTSSRWFTATTADGATFELRPVTEGTWVIEASSPWWWGDAQDLRDQLADGAFELAERGPFTADEWPPLPR